MTRLHLLCLCALLAAGCSRGPSDAAGPVESTPQGSPAPAAAREPLDACTLLTSDEVRGVMGEAVSETKPDRETTGGFVISQCYFSLPTPANSLTLRLIEKGQGADARSPREAWRETFARDLENAIDHRKGGVQIVPELGDEAFWMGGGAAGGLYVLKGDRYFRLGLGGDTSQEAKIEKGKVLAAAILQRL